MALGALIIKENPCLRFFPGLEGFQFKALIVLSMMVSFHRRLPEKTINDCSERIVRDGKQRVEQKSQGDNNDREEPAPATLERPIQDAKACKSHQGFC